ncbi:hypothetical protein BC351_00010 [Paenibacillus ferrarius]|uniref:Uncharacterized protein n=1 Tax=Paenibacillus ferrarius TaxID=1469647 RepID=A0A1V4HRU4_9BACL|nr:hypothetical protein [Paenibacillus ferrarius]OPH61664.1 hypothetical protein BC351_00010 [Paenibacillus ferrarius]
MMKMRLGHYLLTTLITLLVCPTILQLIIIIFIANERIAFESFLGTIVFAIFTIPTLVVIGIPSSILINKIVKRINRLKLLFETIFYIVFAVLGVVITILALNENKDHSNIFDKDNLLIYSYGILCALTFQTSLRLTRRWLKF